MTNAPMTTPQQPLSVAVLQLPLVWQHASANRAAITSWLDQVTDVDLIVLPEMFNSGFSMQPQLFAEDANGETIQWLKTQAATRQCALAGSIAVRIGTDAEPQYVNRLLFVTPDGQVQQYDKRHLFRMGNEHQHYHAGEERVVVTYRGWRLLLQICYDLRFPVFARNRNDYDAALYVANWPAPRARIWSTLLSARAIENQAFVIGCNRVGDDANGLSYSGDSVILDFVGAPLCELAPHTPGLLTAVLDKAALEEFRRNFPAALDADSFQLDA